MASASKVFKEVRVQVKADNISVKAAGVAFFALLALIPAMFATVSIYALVSDPDEVTEQITDALSSAPEEVQSFFASQLSSLADGSSGGLGVAAAIAILLALWSASGAIRQLMATLNEIHAVPETRGFVRLRGTALLFLVGAVLFLVVTMFLLGFLPGILSSADIGAGGRWAAGVMRFPVMFALMVLGLSILYHFGPARPLGRRFRAFSAGAVVATTIWIVLSGLLSVYTANFAQMNETFATFGSFLVLQVWLLVTSFSVLIGAEIDEVRDRVAALERRPGARDDLEPPREIHGSALAGAVAGLAVGMALGRSRQKDKAGAGPKEGGSKEGGSRRAGPKAGRRP